MIDHVKIQNFRCFKRVEAALKSLTVLIGPNDSGKSSFLAALQVLAGVEPSREDHWQLSMTNNLSMQANSSSNRASLSTRIDQQHGITARQTNRVGMLPSARSILLPSAGVPMTAQVQPDESGPPGFGSDGAGVPALLDHLVRVERPRFDALHDAVTHFLPNVVDVVARAPAPDTRRLYLRLREGLEISAERCSTGVRAMLFYLGMTYHPNPPDLILLEEPENGVHPKRLADIMKLLRSITKGEHCGHAAQIILTTHSPYLLDHVNLDEDQVLVFKRNDDGSRTAEPVDRERLKSFLDDFMLGEVWFNEGEEGLVKRGS